MVRTLQQRAEWVLDQACMCLCERIEVGFVQADNEASYQLHLAALIKDFGETCICSPGEIFRIELEKSVKNSEALFQKSGSRRANIDIWFSISNILNATTYRVAIELKFFKKENQREPNNRADVFKDMVNLESYGEHADAGVMIVLTNHSHYVSKADYSVDTADFDFRHGKEYSANKILTYKTPTPYVNPITLRGSYVFNWISMNDSAYFLRFSVNPQMAI